MSIIIRDDHLEQQIDKIRASRGDKTMAKTASDLLREYLTTLNIDEAYRSTPTHVAPEIPSKRNSLQKT